MCCQLYNFVIDNGRILEADYLEGQEIFYMKEKNKLSSVYGVIMNCLIED